MTWVQYAGANAPEAFLLLAVAIGTVLGGMRICGFAVSASACILIDAVILGQLGTFVIALLLRSERGVHRVPLCVWSASSEHGHECAPARP
jgi:putative transport protein